MNRVRSGRSLLRSGLFLGIGIILLVGGRMAVPAGQEPDRPFPNIVRVRVPQDRVSALLPAAAEVRSVTSEELDALVSRARAGWERSRNRPTVRLLRADHVAVWRDGLLEGRSTILADVGTSTGIRAAPGGIRAEAVLEPWSPALEAHPQLVTGEDGRLRLRVASEGPARFELRWTLRARAGSEGRAFALDLPTVDLGSLVLDLPQGLEAESGEPVDAPEAGRSRWRITPAVGNLTLFLADAGQGGGAGPSGRVWVEGPTIVEVPDALARWQVDWTIERGARRTLRVLLEPGMDLTDVVGRSVASHRESRRADGRTEVEVRFSDPQPGAETVRFRGVASVPFEGTWSVPSLSPLDATWTGGGTSVLIGPGRIVTTVRERSGRRIAPGLASGTSPVADSSVLRFEPMRTGPVADLELRRPPPLANASVRGRLRIDGARQEIDAWITWSFARGRLLEASVEIPSGWSVEQVRDVGTGDAVSWHAEPALTAGGPYPVRLDSGPVSSLTDDRTVHLRAARSLGDSDQSFDLPRVRPLGVAAVEESWVAFASPSRSEAVLRPREVRGLAWIDPADARLPESEPGRAPGFAWRWLSDEARAEIESRPGMGRAPIEVLTRAVLRGGRLDVVSLVRKPPGGDPRAPWLIVPPSGGEVAWESVDPSTGSAALVAVSAGPDGLVRLGPGVPENASVLRMRGSWDWSGTGSLPLGDFSNAGRVEGFLWIEAGPELQVEATPGPGMLAVDPGRVRALFESRFSAKDRTAPPRSEAIRPVAAFRYDDAAPKVELASHVLAPGRTTGLIRDALYETAFDDEGRARTRVTLDVLPLDTPSLTFSPAPNRRIEQVLRDGTSVSLFASPDGYALPLPVSGRSWGERCLVRLDLDFLNGPDDADGRSLSNLPLSTSWPMLGVRWDARVPRSWEPTGTAIPLTLIDPLGSAARPESLGSPQRGAQAGKSTATPDPARVAFTEGVLSGSETTWGDLLTRLDAGPRPIVVDRLALQDVGIGPGTRMPARSGSAVSSIEEFLKPFGLILTRLDDLDLFTTAASPTTPVEPVRRAAGLGSDFTDRFQSVHRWRNEANPLGPTLGAIENGTLVPEPSPGSETQSRFRYATVSAPRTSFDLAFSDATFGAALGIAVGFAVFGGGLVVARRRPSHRGILVLGVVALGFGIASWLSDLGSVLRLGLLDGALAASTFWWGCALRTSLRRRGTSVPEPGTASGDGRALVGASVVVLVLVLADARTRAAEEPEPSFPEGSIIAVLPYDGVPEAIEHPTRALLRLADYRWLDSWAARDAEPKRLPRVGVRSASHRVEGDGPEVRVRTRLDLIVDGEGVASWSFPLGAALGTEARLDDQPIAVAIEPGGRRARILLENVPSGPHTLDVSRRVRVESASYGRRIVLPIDPVAASRAEVAPTNAGERVEITAARGGPWPGAETERVTAVALGPAATLEVRWVKPGAETLPASPSRVEAVALWDAAPTGDRVRSIWTVRGPSEIGRLRFRLEPGSILGRVEVNGRVDVRREGTAVAPEWVAVFDPPLTDGSRLRMDVRRPVSTANSSVPAPSPRSIRDMPQVEPLDVTSFVGMVGFRRPSDWSGRLGAAFGLGSVPDEEFVRAWGEALPDDPLTLAGAARLDAKSRIRVDTGPRPIVAQVRDEVVLKAEAGGIRVVGKSVRAEGSARSTELRATLPQDLRVLKVRSEGLTSWEREPSGRLRLRFDGARPDRISVEWEGLLPLGSEDPAAPGRDTEQTCELPWPVWDGADAQPGFLTIEGSGSGTLDPAVVGGAVVPVPAMPVIPTRRTYQVVTSERLPALKWKPAPPRADARVESRLIVGLRELFWTASAEVQLTGGPQDKLLFRLPAEWSSAVRAEVNGRAVRPSFEVRGSVATWTISPQEIGEARFWGTHRVRLSARRPWSGPETIAYPAFVPLGRGSVETFLGWLDLSGSDWGVQALTGLELLEPGTEAGGGPEHSVEVRYRVTQPEWGLTLRNRSGTADARPAHREEFLRLVVAPDRTVLGESQGRYDARATGDVPIELDPRAELLAASLDDRLVRPYRGRRSGLWILPSAPDASGRLALVWRIGPGASELELPASTAREGTTTPIVIHLPDGLAARTSGLRSSSFGEAATVRAEALGETIETTAPAVSEPKARRTVIESLIEFDLLGRDLVRWERFGREAANAGAPVPASLLTRWKTAQTRMRGSFAAAPAAALLDEARGATSPNGPASSLKARPEMLRVRALGRPAHYLRATSSPARLWIDQNVSGASEPFFASPTAGYLLLTIYALAVLGTIRATTGTNAEPAVLAVNGALLLALAAWFHPSAWVCALVPGVIGWFVPADRPNVRDPVSRSPTST